MDEKKKTQKESERLLQVNWSSERLLEKCFAVSRRYILRRLLSLELEVTLR